MIFPDVINPLDGLVGRTLHGPMHRFLFSREGDFTGADVERMLRQYGIRIWGRELDLDDELAFLVKKSQAVWAEYLLCRAGVPLTSPLIDERNAQYVNSHEADTMPLPWTEKGIGPRSFVDHVVVWLDRLLS